MIEFVSADQALLPLQLGLMYLPGRMKYQNYLLKVVARYKLEINKRLQTLLNETESYQ